MPHCAKAERDRHHDHRQIQHQDEIKRYRDPITAFLMLKVRIKRRQRDRNDEAHQGHHAQRDRPGFPAPRGFPR